MITIPTAIQFSDGDLLSAASRVAAEGRQVTADLIALLAVLVERRLFAAEGYGTAHDFCVRRLHLSDAQAYHRLAAAHVAWRFPTVLAGLRDGRLTLTTVALLRPHLTEENAVRVLAWAEGRGRREVECFVRSLAPLPDVPSSIRKVPVPRQAVGTPGVAVSESSMVGSAPKVSASACVEGSAPSLLASRPSVACEAAPAVASAVSRPRAGERADPPAGADASLVGDGLFGTAAEVEKAPVAGAGAAADRAYPASAPAEVGVRSGVTAAPPARPADIHPLTPTRYSVRLTISDTTLAKLRRAADLLGHAVPTNDLAEVFDRALTVLVEQLERTKYAVTPPNASAAPAARPHGPRRTARRPPSAAAVDPLPAPAPDAAHERPAPAAADVAQEPPAPVAAAVVHRPPAPAERVSAGTPPASARRRSRYIPAAVRREVYLRDQGRCTYTGPGGRCGRTRRLEIHHRVPFAEGGPSTAENCSLRCSVHNRWEAAQWFGEDFDRSKSATSPRAPS